jgi:glycosyltransferase involved in cell wall biosynthesis
LAERRLRVKWLANTPGLNQVDFFDALYKREEIELTLIYCDRQNPKWQGSDGSPIRHKHKFLRKVRLIPERIGSIYIYRGILKEVAQHDFDLFVVSGGLFPTMLSAMACCNALRIPYTFWGEMIDRAPTRLKIATKTVAIYPLLRRAQAVMTMGEQARTSYRSIGVPSEKLFELPYSCDLRPYLALNNRSRLRANRYRIVTVSRLIALKRVDLIIQAFLLLATQYPAWDLVIYGSGPLGSQLIKQVPDSLANRIVFGGFLKKEDQPKEYQNAHIFAIASDQDGWGMVVPEAMAAGLPVIATNGVQSAQVMIEDGINGYLIERGDVGALARGLDALMRDIAQRTEMGTRARITASRYHAEPTAALCTAHLERIWDERIHAT